MKTLEEVIAEYPNLFREKKHCGYHCGKGWVPLIEMICKYVTQKQEYNYISLVNKTEAQACADIGKPLFSFKFDQIKEKFGFLRTYYSVWEAEDVDFTKFDEYAFHKEVTFRYGKLEGFICAMSHMSGRTCEDTGAPGTQYTSHKGGGWIRTLSPERAKELRYELLQESEQEREPGSKDPGNT
jgi:hypothetical protein